MALRPIANAQGGYFFFSLDSSRRVTANQWRQLPIPQQVIDMVHQLARKGREINSLQFLNRNGNVLEDQDLAGVNSISDSMSQDTDDSDSDYTQESDSDETNNSSDDSSDEGLSVSDGNDTDRFEHEDHLRDEQGNKVVVHTETKTTLPSLEDDQGNNVRIHLEGGLSPGGSTDQEDTTVTHAGEEAIADGDNTRSQYARERLRPRRQQKYAATNTARHRRTEVAKRGGRNQKGGGENACAEERETFSPRGGGS